MKIVVHDFVGHAFPIQLSRELATRGHTVHHIYFSGFQGPKGPLLPQAQDPESLSIDSMSLAKPYPKYNYLRRFLMDVEYAKLCSTHLGKLQPDVVLSGGASPTVQRQLLKYCRTRSIPFVYWVQDWYGIAAEKVFARKLGLLGNGIGRFISYQEQKTVRDSDGVVVISEDFLSPLGARATSNIAVIENWAVLNEMVPRPKRNPWSIKNGIADKKVFLYTGTLGLKHNPELLVALAERWKSSSDTVMVVVTEGLGRKYLENRKLELGLSNLLLFDFQPFDELSNVISSGDVLVAVIESDAGVFSVPSKVLAYLCADRPLLLAVPAANLAARIVTRNRAGLVVDPADSQGFIRAGETLISDEALGKELAQNGREYAVRNFDIEDIAAKFESVFHAATAAREAASRRRL
jgi:colanic acid biosynthesis glycosyl transferase WcaI